MAKCKTLTGSAVKGLMSTWPLQLVVMMMLVMCDVDRDLQACFSCSRNSQHHMTSPLRRHRRRHRRRHHSPSNVYHPRVATAPMTFNSCDIWPRRSWCTSTHKVITLYLVCLIKNIKTCFLNVNINIKNIHKNVKHKTQSVWLSYSPSLNVYELCLCVTHV